MGLMLGNDPHLFVAIKMWPGKVKNRAPQTCIRAGTEIQKSLDVLTVATAFQRRHERPKRDRGVCMEF